MPSTTQVEATLNINAIGARTDFAGTDADDLSAEEIRFDQAQYTEGVLKPVEGYEPNAGGGGTMNVIIGSGSAKTDYMIVEGDTVGQGSYVVRLDDVTKTITLSAANPSNERIDEIYLVVLDDVYDSNGSQSLPIFAVREGDAGGGAPGPDSGWEASIKIATITIPAGISDITEATVTDSRVFTDLAFANGGSMPVGGGFLWFASVAPTGHILARGQLEDPADYPRLFQIWGTSYGGDGSSTFGVPDLRQRMPLGRADSGTGDTVGDTGGSIDHTHTGPSHTHSGPSHTHSVNPPNTNTSSNGSHSHGNPTMGLAGSHTHGGATGGASKDTGGGHLFDGNVNTHTHSISVDGSHLHSLGDTDSVGNHNHSVNIGSFNSGAAGTGQTGAAGTGATGTANPPYLVVEYAIRAA